MMVHLVVLTCYKTVACSTFKPGTLTVKKNTNKIVFCCHLVLLVGPTPYAEVGVMEPIIQIDEGKKRMHERKANLLGNQNYGSQVVVHLVKRTGHHAGGSLFKALLCTLQREASQGMDNSAGAFLSLFFFLLLHFSVCHRK